MIDEMVWQSIVAYSIVFFAAIWLFRRLWRTLMAIKNGRVVSGKCAGCPGGTAARRTTVKQLVQIGPKSRNS